MIYQKIESFLAVRCSMDVFGLKPSEHLYESLALEIVILYDEKAQIGNSQAMPFSMRSTELIFRRVLV